MRTTNQSANSINQAVQTNIRYRDSAKKQGLATNDKYKVKVVDGKGNEYTIEYL